MLIRQYCEADMGAIIDIWYEGWHSIDSKLVHPHSRTEWRDRWVSQITPKHEIAVAESDNEILGFVTLNLETSELSQLFTRLPEQGQGVGTALINWVKNRCHKEIYLFTLEINYRSREFYEKHGFSRDWFVNQCNQRPSHGWIRVARHLIIACSWAWLCFYPTVIYTVRSRDV